MLTLRCDCYAHYVDLDIYFDEDSYLVFHSRFGANNSWRSRLKTAWDVLRGQRHLLDEVILRQEEVDRLRMFLGLVSPRSPNSTGVGSDPCTCEPRTTCQICDGPYDEEADDWGVCSGCVSTL